MPHRRCRTRSTSCSSTTSQSSMTSIYAGFAQGSPLVEPTEGRTNAYGSFTTTIPATLWLRAHLSLLIPHSTSRRTKQRDLDSAYDTPPDSPLSFLRSGFSRSPSISRTLTDSDWVESMRPAASPSPSPSTTDDVATKLDPLLEALERGSKFSCRTTCSTCNKTGTNFPRCPRCNDMWCSRACRLQGGKRHKCANREI